MPIINNNTRTNPILMQRSGPFATDTLTIVVLIQTGLLRGKLNYYIL